MVDGEQLALDGLHLGQAADASMVDTEQLAVDALQLGPLADVRMVDALQLGQVVDVPMVEGEKLAHDLFTNSKPGALHSCPNSKPGTLDASKFDDLDWAAAPEDGAWAAGAWGPGQWAPVVPEPKSLELSHWCVTNLILKKMESKIEKSVYYQMRENERRRALARRAPENELNAIDSFYVPFAFWLADNKQYYHDADNVRLCELYDEYRNLIYAELYFDIYCPLKANRSPKVLHQLSEILKKAKAITDSIEERGNLAMPVLFQWWVDLNGRRQGELALNERQRKINMGKSD